MFVRVYQLCSQRSAIGSQLLTVNCLLSTVNCQLSIVNISPIARVQGEAFGYNSEIYCRDCRPNA
ncbi:MAG: hypothetical protein ACRC62_23730 [Microcoleus sp.]